MKIRAEIAAVKSNQNGPNTTPISLKLEKTNQAKCVAIYFCSVQSTVGLVLFPKAAQCSRPSLQQCTGISSITHISLLTAWTARTVIWFPEVQVSPVPQSLLLGPMVNYRQVFWFTP